MTEGSHDNKLTFKDVHYCLAAGVKNPDEIKKLLDDGGAKFVNYLSDIVTHYISDDPDEDVSEALEIYEKPVVTSQWVRTSAKCGTLLPVAAYSPLKNQLFSKIKACPSKLCRGDLEAIWAMITYHGGVFSLDLTPKTTHLITTKPEGEKYSRALERGDKVKIVTPDWVVDSLKAKALSDEDLYHPRLLVFAPQSKQEPLTATNSESQRSSHQVPTPISNAAPSQTAVSSAPSTTPFNLRSVVHQTPQTVDTSPVPGQPSGSVTLRTVSVSGNQMVFTTSNSGQPSAPLTLRTISLPSHQPGAEAPSPSAHPTGPPPLRPGSMPGQQQMMGAVPYPQAQNQYQQMQSGAGRGERVFIQTQQQQVRLMHIQQQQQQQQQQHQQHLHQQQQQQSQQHSQNQPQLSPNVPVRGERIYVPTQQPAPIMQVQQQNQAQLAQNSGGRERMYLPSQQQGTVMPVSQQQAQVHLPPNAVSQGRVFVSAQQQVPVMQMQQNQPQIPQNAMIRGDRMYMQPQVRFMQVPQQQGQPPMVQTIGPRGERIFVPQQQVRLMQIPQQHNQMTQNMGPRPYVQAQHPQHVQVMQGQQSHPQPQMGQGVSGSDPRAYVQNQQHVRMMQVQQHPNQPPMAQATGPRGERVFLSTQPQTPVMQMQNQPQIPQNAVIRGERVYVPPQQGPMMQMPPQSQGAAIQNSAPGPPRVYMPPQQQPQQQQHVRYMQMPHQNQVSMQRPNMPSAPQRPPIRFANMPRGNLVPMPPQQQPTQQLPMQQSPVQQSQQPQQLQQTTQHMPMPQPPQNFEIPAHLRQDPEQSIISPKLFGHEPKTQIPQRSTFLGCVFYIVDYEELEDKERIEKWRRCIIKYGGDIESSYTSRVTHVLCENQTNPIVQQALKDSKRVITIWWVDDVIRDKLNPPWSVFHFPCAFSPNDKPAKDHIITSSGFIDQERTKVRDLVKRIGAKYTGYLSDKNTVLVCKSQSGQKYEQAGKWRLPIVNVKWLIDIYLGNIDVTTHTSIPPKYQQFDAKDPFKVEYVTASKFFHPWKTPIKVAPDVLRLRAIDIFDAEEEEKKAQEEKERLEKEKIEKQKQEQETNIKKENDVSQTEGLPLENNIKQEIEEVAKPPENELSILNHVDQLPTNDPIQEPPAKKLKTSNGEPDTFPTSDAVFSVPAPPPPLPSLIQNQMSNGKQDNSKYKIILTGFLRSEHEELKNIIRELGGKLVTSPKEATHMISKNVVRTVKFLCGFNFCRFILKADWLKESGKQKRFLNETEYTLEDPENESLFGISVRASLEKRNLRGTKVLDKYVFYVTPSCLPHPTVIKEIIESAGGKAVINKPASSNQIQQMQQVGLKYMIIACDNDLHICTKYFERRINVVHVEFVYCAILKQEVDVTSFALKPLNSSTISESFSATPNSINHSVVTPNHTHSLVPKLTQ